MSNLINRQWTLAARPDGNVKDSDFRFVEAPIRDLEDGEFLVRSLYLSLAPVMRMYMFEGGVGVEAPLEFGDVIHGRGVGEVVDSRHPEFVVGDIVHGQIGWQAYKITRAIPQERFIKFGARDLSPALALGVLGMTGFSAYCGLVEVGEPKPGDVVVLSGAAGGVGSIAGQIARLLGCRVVGIAGSDEKCSWLKDELGFHDTINYRTDDIAERLDALCPNGIDLYFDNVGGEILDLCLERIAWKGRIVLCGSISEYMRDEPFGPKNYTRLRGVNASMRGFYVYNHPDSFAEAERRMAQWVRDGVLKHAADVLEGIEQMPRALARLYDGNNKGKQIVRIAEPSLREG